MAHRKYYKFRRRYKPWLEQGQQTHFKNHYRRKNRAFGSQKPITAIRSTRTVGEGTGTGKIAQIANNGSTDQFYALKFTLDDLPNYTEFTSLWDMYMIKCIKLKFIPVKNQMNITTSGTLEIPVVGLAYDYDDSSVPTSMNQLRQYSTYRQYQSNKQFSIKIYPKFAIAAYAGGIVNGYVKPTSKLQKMFRLDCANPAIEHYGIKIGIPDTGSGTAGLVTYDIHATYYLNFYGYI